MPHESRLPTLWGLDGQDQLMPVHLYSSGIFIFGGLGTDTDPYLIETEAQLRSLAELVNAGTGTYAIEYYKLTADITLIGE